MDDVLHLNSLCRASLHIVEHLLESSGGRHAEMALQSSRGMAELEHRTGVEYSYGDFRGKPKAGLSGSASIFGSLR